MVERLSVHRLLALAMDVGSLGGMAPGNAAQVGAHIHRQLQAEAPPEAKCEVLLRRGFPEDAPVIEVSGRVDCTYVDDSDTRVIEEIKSVAGLPEQPTPAFWMQALLYAWMMREGGPYRTCVICVDRETRQMARFEEVFSQRQVDQAVLPLLERAAQRRRAAHARRAALAASGVDLPLPYASLRPGQDELMDTAAEVLAREEILLAEAPTGIGKTMGSLYPAALRLGQEGAPECAFYATAKNTAKKAAMAALGHLQEMGLRGAFVELSSKETLCASPGAGCNPAMCPRSLDYYARRGPALEKALASETGFSRAVIKKIADKHKLCPFEFSLDLAENCPFVIGDLNYVFDPHVQIQRLFGPMAPKARRPLLLQDEAHNLVDRARDIFSAQLNSGELDACRALAEPLAGFEDVGFALDQLAGLFSAQHAQMKENNQTLQMDDGPGDVLRGYLQEAVDCLSPALGLHAPGDVEPLRALFFALRGACDACDHFAEGYRMWWDGRSEALGLHLYCVDPSGRLGKTLARARGAVLFSATLSPLEYFQRLLCPGAETLALPSPFARENLLVLMDATIRTTLRSREGDYHRVAAQLMEMAQGKPGNYLAFFPSFAYLQGVTPYLRGEGVRIQAQRSGMPERARREFLSSFAAPPTDGSCLLGLAVLGGVFAEGIDLAGESLIGVAVVGVGWPQLSPEREMLKTAFEEEGLSYAYVYPGLHRVIQAAGRLIRAEEDRGVLMLLDERFAKEPFCDLLPDGWEVVPVNGPEETRLAMEEFW